MSLSSSKARCFYSISIKTGRPCRQHVDVNDHQERQPVDSEDSGAAYSVTVPGLAVLSREEKVLEVLHIDVNDPSLSSL